MNLHRYELDLPLDPLVAETRRVVEGWNWNRGAFGHALSLPAYRQLHPYNRYSYQNYPCAGLLDECPLLSQIFEGLETEKVAFRLLRREPSSSYGWHTDRYKGPGVVRFQIPIVSEDAAFLVTTDYRSPDQVQGPRSGNLSADSFDAFARANEGHFNKHHLEPGQLHYFDTTRVHTLVNPGPGERITLSFDLHANDWLLDRFPEIRAEVGDGPVEPLPRPGPLQRGRSFARSRLFPLRNRARVWLGERAGQKS